MSQYTTDEITLWLSRANKTLYKLGPKSTDERFFENDDRFENERILIYGLKKAITWLYAYEDTDQEKLARIVSLLISRISLYGWGTDALIYSISDTEVPGSTGGYVDGGYEPPAYVVLSLPDDLTLIGGTDISIGLNVFSDTRLTGRFRIVRNNIPFYLWYRIGTSIYLIGVGDQVTDGDVFVFEYY